MYSEQGKKTFPVFAPFSSTSTQFCLLIHCGINAQVDIYSFALVLWFMCTGERPLMGATQRTFLEAASRHQYLRPDLKPIVFKPIADLMERCWAADPKDRLPADKIVEWLTEMPLPSNPKKKASSSGDKCTVQ